jgi:hypothetical protein
MGDFNYKEYLKNNPLLREEVKEEKLITESQKEVQEYVETSGDPVGDDLKKLKAFVDKSGSKAKAAFKNFLDSIEVGSMQKAMASEELEVTEEISSSKMKVSELKAKIKEDIISLLQEAEEDVDVDVEDDVEADVDVDVKDKVNVDAEGDDIEIEKKAVKAKVDVGLSPEEEIVQDSLKAARDAAVSLGNEILADQIGNTITYFTRKVVVGDRTD